jgi:hypothetical protein
MADAHTRTRSLAAELAAANYQADDLPNLARNVYVRCLLKGHAAAGRSASVKSVALKVTAHVLKQLVGFHFTLEDVQALLDEEEEAAGKEPPPTPNRAKPATAAAVSPPRRRAPPT